MAGLSLYELERIYQDVLDLSVENEEDAAAMVALLDEAADAVDVKVCKIGHVMLQLDAEAAALDEEIKRLSERRAVRRSKRARLIDYVRHAMDAVGLRKCEQVDITVAIQKSPPSLRIINEKAAPAEFWNQPPPVLDKTALKAWVKEHPDNGCAVLEQGEHVRVR